MKVDRTIEIDRPVDVVWHFVAVDHVRNHPRWDPDVKLELPSEGPIAVGTVVNRTISRLDRVTEGWMQCVRFDTNQAIQFEIHDGPTEMTGGADFARMSADRTRLTIWADIPGVSEEIAEKIWMLMLRSVENIKRLVETET